VSAAAPKQPKFVAYVVIDINHEPAAPVAIKLSRQLCREFVLKQPNAGDLRVRRAKVFLFDS
jgi:hypothetical protein